MKNSLKNKFLIYGKNTFHRQEHGEIEKDVFQHPENEFLLGAIQLFLKNWCPHNLNNAPLAKASE